MAGPERVNSSLNIFLQLSLLPVNIRKYWNEDRISGCRVIPLKDGTKMDTWTDIHTYLLRLGPTSMVNFVSAVHQCVVPCPGLVDLMGGGGGALIEQQHSE